MARTQGPLFSLEARGGFGNNLIYQHQNGQGVVKKFAKPKNPNSTDQTSCRQAFVKCSNAWKELGTACRSTWNLSRHPGEVKGKSLFFSVNLQRLKGGLDILVSYSPILESLNNSERLQVYRYGNDFYIRSAWGSSTDLVHFLQWRNPSISQEASTSWSFTKTCPRNTVSSNFNSASFTYCGYEPSDDITPVWIDNSYVGGDHGWVSKMTSTTNAGHGFTNADIGKIFSTGNILGGYAWVLHDILNSTQAVWLNCGQMTTNGPLHFNSMIGPLWGPYPTWDKSLTINAQSNEMIHPSTRGISRSALLENSTPLNDGECRVARSFDLIESYNILRAIHDGTSLSMFDAQVNSPGAIIDFSNPSITAEMQVDVQYHFTANGACTITTRLTHHFDTAIGYYGFVQQLGLQKPIGGSGAFVYVPKTIAMTINGRTYNLTTTPVDISTGNPATDLNMYDIQTANWTNANTPPDRFIEYVKDSGGTKTAGHCLGFCPIKDIGVPSIRKTLTTVAGRLGQKIYPFGIANGGSALATYSTGHSKIAANTVIDATAYRCPINYEQNPDATNVSWYAIDDGSIILNLDFHQTIDRIISLPASFSGKAITVIDTAGTITIVDSVIGAEGLHVQTTTYGSACLKLT